MVLQLIQLITLFLMLLVTGVFWGPWLALHRSLHLFNKEDFIKITNIIGKNLGRPMQILMPMCIVFMGLSIFLYPNKSHLSFYFILASFGCMIITLIVTMTTELPIVNKIRQWKAETTPLEWEAIRDKWVSFHALRVFPSMASFVLYVLAILYKF